MKVIWLPRAVADLNGHLDYIAIDDRRMAVEIGGRIFEHISHLARYPNIGRQGRRSRTRELVIPRTPFVVVYRINADHLEILRLLHGAQKWPPTG